MDDWATRLRAAGRSIAELDLRSLALFRVGLGLIIAIDAASRLTDVEAFYADSGIRPRGPDMLANIASAPSLYLANGSVAYASILLVATAFVGLVVALGYWTRIATLAAWVLVVSVQNRNPTVNSGADSVLAVLCLLGCFLPLGARCSVDATRTGPERSPLSQTASTWGTCALTFQLVIIYAFNVANKLWGATWRDGRAVQAALNVDQHTTPLGHFVLEHMLWICRPLTYGALVIETAVLVLLVPVTSKLLTVVVRDRLRLGIIAAMWALHIGFAVCLYLALFSPVCMVAWLALLPSSTWERGPWARFIERTGIKRRLAPGTGDAPRLPAWGAALLAIAMAMQLATNIANTTRSPLPAPVAAAIKPFRVGSLWKMFAPNPGFNKDGWWVMPATLANGDVVDLFRDGAMPVTFEKPRYVSHLYKNGRWRQMMMGRVDDKNGTVLRKHAGWLCRAWNRTHDDEHRVETVSVVFMQENTRGNLKPVKPDRHDLLVAYACPGEAE